LTKAVVTGVPTSPPGSTDKKEKNVNAIGERGEARRGKEESIRESLLLSDWNFDRSQATK